MKKYLVVSIAFVILAGVSCQGNNNIQKEKDAILNFFKPYSEYVLLGNNFQNLF